MRTDSSAAVPPPTHEFMVPRDDETYVVVVDGDQLLIGRRLPDLTTASGFSIPVEELGGEARRALEHGDWTCPALLIGLRYLVAASVTPDSRLSRRERGAILA